MTPEERADQVDAAYRNWVTGVAPIHPDLAIKVYSHFMADAIRAAVAEEREACALVVEENYGRRTLSFLVALIRGRGEGAK